MSARNETTGAEYRGGNVMRLESCELEHGYSPDRGWAGYRQWLEAGRVVRKGEHGTACLTVVTVAGDPETGKGAGRKARGFRVFHYDQTVPLEPVSKGGEGGRQLGAFVLLPAADMLEAIAEVES